MGQPTKNIKLTTCEVAFSREVKQRLTTLVQAGQSAADIVVGRCEDCGALIYADDILTPVPEPTPEPVDEWEYYQ